MSLYILQSDAPYTNGIEAPAPLLKFQSSHDTPANWLATLALEHGIWLAPGSYFEPGETDSPWIRFNVATSDAPQLWAFFDAVRGGTEIARAA